MNAVLFNFLFIKDSKKKVLQVPKNIKQHNSFNTDNKSAYYNTFWRIMWRWRLEADENSVS